MDKVGMVYLEIAKAEIETILDYQRMVMETELGNTDEKAQSIIDEILGDEFNHAIIALLSAAKALEIKIATDDINPDPNDTEVK